MDTGQGVIISGLSNLQIFVYFFAIRCIIQPQLMVPFLLHCAIVSQHIVRSCLCHGVIATLKIPTRIFRQPHTFLSMRLL